MTRTLRDQLIASGAIQPEPAGGTPRLTERRRAPPASPTAEPAMPPPTRPVGPASEPEAPDVLDGFPAFAAAVRGRLDAGRAAYGDASFSAEPAELVEQIREELRDVAAWAYILDCRLAAVARALESQPAPMLAGARLVPERATGRMVGGCGSFRAGARAGATMNGIIPQTYTERSLRVTTSGTRGILVREARGAILASRRRGQKMEQLQALGCRQRHSAQMEPHPWWGRSGGSGDPQ